MRTILFLLVTVSICSAQTEPFTEARLLSEYDSFFALTLKTIEYEGEEHVNLGAQVADPDSDSVFKSLAIKGSRYIEYLLMHGSSLLAHQDEAEEAGEEYLYEVLKGDKRFKGYFYPIAARYLESQEITQQFFTGEMRQVTAERILQTAARFVYPKWNDEVTNVSFYTCIGINGWTMEKGERDIALEAFAYAALIEREEANSDRNVFDDDMFAHFQKMTEHGVSDQNLIRKQLWDYVAANKNFGNILRAKYQAMKEVLSFTVEGW